MAEAASQYPEQITEEEGSLFARKGKLIIAAVVMLGALGYFGFMAFQSATVYYYTVAEMKDVGPTPDARLVRVSGKLIESSFARQDGSTIANFVLFDELDNSQTMNAMYKGVLPDLFFNDHSEIILEGTYGSDGVFSSQNVIVKCPSKYIALDEEGETPPGDQT